jgi:hypothetical protein
MTRLTREAQRLNRRFLRVHIDFKSDFDSMSQAPLWDILEMFNVGQRYEHRSSQILVRTYYPSPVPRPAWSAPKSHSIREYLK